MQIFDLYYFLEVLESYLSVLRVHSWCDLVHSINQIEVGCMKGKYLTNCTISLSQDLIFSKIQYLILIWGILGGQHPAVLWIYFQLCIQGSVLIAYRGLGHIGSVASKAGTWSVLSSALFKICRVLMTLLSAPAPQWHQSMTSSAVTESDISMYGFEPRAPAL